MPEQTASLTAQRRIDDLAGDAHEFPALLADLGPRAARPHLVVVGHVDIEN